MCVCARAREHQQRVGSPADCREMLPREALARLSRSHHGVKWSSSPTTPNRPLSSGRRETNSLTPFLNPSRFFVFSASLVSLFSPQRLGGLVIECRHRASRREVRSRAQRAFRNANKAKGRPDKISISAKSEGRACGTLAERRRRRRRPLAVEWRVGVSALSPQNSPGQQQLSLS